MLSGVPLFAKRIESMENIRSIVSSEVAKYLKRGVNIEVNYIEDKPIIHVSGQLPMGDGKVKVIETLYLGSSGDGSEEHSTVMIQYEYGSLRIVGQVMVINVYEGVLLSREYVVNLGDEFKVLSDVVKVTVVGRDYVKIKDAIESARQQSTQQAKAASTQQSYYAI
ncbi:hypothetical protein [Caldivirga maquilingensis]|uniref:Uncharacterized protein n=1 Tax=Caldivirga maquilingensis (strain ATCC 700844 / DSM 13496 / JCM 10307 / IC-167) TaxID=397948 RepID=A8MA29_CALMQ|nr:hypothetical protein [Caldivirga maquilingensis]ABW00961.1 hypothetical protein Cmaq_0107 [Caldivirga maquilingensis IC-167]